jgi:hypothetical protein
MGFAGCRNVSASTVSGPVTKTFSFIGKPGSATKVVTINYAFDNATTLAKLNVCTVYGSVIAT